MQFFFCQSVIIVHTKRHVRADRQRESVEEKHKDKNFEPFCDLINDSRGSSFPHHH